MLKLLKASKAVLKLALPFLPVFAAALLHISSANILVSLSNGLFDQYQRWHPRQYEPAPVRIVDIDEASIKRYGQWPWPRSRMAELTDRLTSAGVAAIGFDVMFAEADRTAPKAIAELWQLPGDLRQRLLALPDHDLLLANSLRQADAVIGFMADTGTAKARTQAPIAKGSFVYLGEPQTRWLRSYSNAIQALTPLEEAAKGTGALTFVPDLDGVVRRVPMVLLINGTPLATLASETLRVAQGARIIALRSAGHMDGITGERDNAGLGEIKIGELVIPTTPHGEVWVHYTRPVPERTIPAWRLLAGQVPPEALAGNIVLVGSSAHGLLDLRFSPLGLIPGVEAHAQVLEQILTGKYLERPSWARGAELAALVLFGLGIGFLALRTSALVSALACATMLACLTAAGWYAFVRAGLLLDVALPLISVLLTFILCSLVRHLSSEREHRWIKDAFSRYVSPNRVDYLVDNPDAMALGGRRQECSFIFTDLAGFTSLMEKTDPGEAVSLLNDYLDEMIAIAFRHEGTLDRIVGDAVAIMFSAPVQQPDHRRRALTCALEMDAFAAQYSTDLQARGIQFGKTRIGIHAGEVIVGNFGGKNIFDYRALGDPINTAARLESVNKHLGTRICVSEEILRDCADAVVRPIGRLVLKGKTKPLGVYEPIVGAEGYAPLDDYRSAYAALAAEEPQALAMFTRLSEQWPGDPLVRLHLDRLASGSHGDLIVMAEK